jgi:hypothetical protein
MKASEFYFTNTICSFVTTGPSLRQGEHYIIELFKKQTFVYRPISRFLSHSKFITS